MHPSAEAVCADTQRWLERAVIGLNLCPFAKAVHVRQQIHYAVSGAVEPAALLQVLRQELQALVDHPASVRETTLLILPEALQDFLEFNAFLPRAGRLLRQMDLEGVVQIAAFHPQFQFADSESDAVTNCSNRAPYPTLHLLREDSVARAVRAFPDAQAIFETNIQTLRALGPVGWEALDVGPRGCAADRLVPAHGKAP